MRLYQIIAIRVSQFSIHFHSSTGKTGVVFGFVFLFRYAPHRLGRNTRLGDQISFLLLVPWVLSPGERNSLIKPIGS